MKILVAVKRVVDHNVKIRIKPDNSGIETNNIKMAMNPFCEIAVEAALQLREKNPGTEITAVTIGDDSSQETCRHALALGADKAIHLVSDQNLLPLSIAKLLQHLVQQHQFDLVLLGKQSIDGDNNQTGQMLAALLDWPQGTFASAIDLQAGKIHVTREIDAGLETLALNLPAVITTDLRLNEPRYATLPNIMKAKRKPLDKIAVADLALNLSDNLELLRIDPPSVKQAGVRINDVAELVEKLRDEAQVL